MWWPLYIQRGNSLGILILLTHKYLSSLLFVFGWCIYSTLRYFLIIISLQECWIAFIYQQISEILWIEDSLGLLRTYWVLDHRILNQSWQNFFYFKSSVENHQSSSSNKSLALSPFFKKCEDEVEYKWIFILLPKGGQIQF